MAHALLRRGTLTTADGDPRPIEALVLHDVAAPANPPSDARVTVMAGDISKAADCARAVEGATHIVHLAGVMSGDGERDFDLCMRVNLDGTRNIIDAARALGTAPRLLFASSTAVFGEADTQVPSDLTKIVPKNTYGVTKACGEMLVNDATRRGFVDGRAARLPTVIVRPGKPNAAVTSCFSGIIREPLAGKVCVVPIPLDLPHAVTSTRCIVSNLITLLDTPASRLGSRVERAFNLPARKVTLRELVSALHNVVEPDDLSRLGPIVQDPDPFLSKTVAAMCAHDFVCDRAKAIGVDEVPELAQILSEYVSDFGTPDTCRVRLRSKL
eukprot:TRINITY_DN24665_c0_g1_i1.p1 TRINITY_DN24665_c0_g1~~TRINITY_DN24665_c0_g1_i1.p1  ORF type:complete len:341 (+),score=88.11 TRINITY_DN24665_c0_g1_i1:45-1025(+)